MNIADLLVTAESCRTGERIIGYVCGCKSCATPFEGEEVDTRKVRVYTDTLELVNDKIKEVE